jgi:peptidoglycan/LPS O-acetylase OafA/YrhL
MKRRQAAAFYPDTAHIPALDGIRAVAALLVMFLHFTTLDGVPAGIRKVSLAGQTGIDLFFVLSGFLITRILLSSRTSETYFKHFYIRRALRILPLYYAFLVIYFFIRPWLLGVAQPPFAHQIWSWLFLENVPLTFTQLTTEGPNHYWSLAVEEHFYLLWPVLVFFLSRQRLQKLLWIFIVLAPVVRIILRWQDIGVYYFTLSRMDGLAFGALAACLYQKDRVGSRALVLAGRTLMIVMLAILVPMFWRFSGSHADWLQVGKLSFIPGFYFAVMLFCLADPTAKPLRAALSIPPLRWLGKISYGLYVFHPLAFLLVVRLPVTRSNLWLAFATFFSATILIAFISYEFFESRILRCKNKFSYGSRNRVQPGI